MTSPAIRLVASWPSAVSRGTPSRAASSVVHLARRGRRRVDPVHRPEARVGLVVVDVEDGHPPEELGVVTQERTDALQVPAVADDDEVVRHARARVRGGSATRPGMKSYIGGTASAQMGHALPPRASTRRAWASAEPSASASGFSWQTVSTRRAPRSVLTTASGTAATSAAVRETGVIWGALGRGACAPAAARGRRGRRWPAWAASRPAAARSAPRGPPPAPR